MNAAIVLTKRQLSQSIQLFAAGRPADRPARLSAPARSTRLGLSPPIRQTPLGRGNLFAVALRIEFDVELALILHVSPAIYGVLYQGHRSAAMLNVCVRPSLSVIDFVNP
jgi:hypothetical protein